VTARQNWYKLLKEEKMKNLSFETTSEVGGKKVKATGNYEAFTSFKEITKISDEALQVKILSDVNRQLKTDAMNTLRASLTRELSSVSVIKKAVKALRAEGKEKEAAAIEAQIASIASGLLKA